MPHVKLVLGAAAVTLALLLASAPAPGQDSWVDIAAYRVVRQVAMFYRLDLFTDNSLAKAMAEVMRKSEEAVRQCYVDRLDSQPTLRGEIGLTFEVPAATGNMETIELVSGSLKDKTLIACLKERLGALTFSLPRGVSGRLDYTFDSVERRAPEAQP
jgi:hypothetical protein